MLGGVGAAIGLQFRVGGPSGRDGGARRIGRTRGGLNTKLHAVCDGVGRPLLLLLTRGQMSDHTGAKLLIDALPPARELVADCGYDSDRFRAALEARGIRPCIPPRRNRKHPRPWDRDIYRHRHRIENMFGRLKDWRRIATRYDRCADLFRAAVVFAATVIFWLRM